MSFRKSLIALVAISIMGSAPATKSQEVAAPQNEALAAQHDNALPLTPFYDLQGADISHAGDLVRSEPGTGYELPGGVTATRIAYASRNESGEPVLTTGVVLVPPGEAPEGGWPIVAWAHGTAGVARVCGPSMMKDVYYGWEGLFLYPLAGYAVVATDYAGLGGPGPHQYMWGRANGNDVAYSVPAAREAVPSLGEKWVAIGHSQGGYAALRVQHMDEEAKAGFLGSIPLGSGANVGDIWAASDPMMRTVGATIPMMALSIKSVYPDFDLTKMLGPAALERLPTIQNETCYFAAEEAMRGVTRERGRVEGWTDVSEAVAFTDKNRIFDAPYDDPILLIVSAGDYFMPMQLRENIFVELCQVASRASYLELSGVDHEGTINGSFHQQLDWLADRFAGREVPQGCTAAK
ncbi:alpha/beta hydrolase [Aurantiacibacter flavus]|uniref:Lipase family protein n=1 Tax=Aurantiacibacter flavus TaxID=3145232 RepID=A0ABV0CV17_9SPHN